MRDFTHWLSQTSVSLAIQNAIWLIAIMQTIHILAVGVVLSSVAAIGARAAGSADAAREVAARFMPWIWAALLALFVTGVVQMVGEPARTLVENQAFQAKMAMLVVALGIAAWFQSNTRTDRIVAINRAAVIMVVALICAIAIAGRGVAYLQAE